MKFIAIHHVKSPRKRKKIDVNRVFWFIKLLVFTCAYLFWIPAAYVSVEYDLSPEFYVGLSFVWATVVALNLFWTTDFLTGRGLGDVGPIISIVSMPLAIVVNVYLWHHAIIWFMSM